MWPKLAYFPERWIQIMDGYAEGKRYIGGLTYSGRPEGFGIIQLEPDTYYVGQFNNGQAYGRGFLLTHKTRTEKKTVTYPGTYEEVMETAEFDGCGRVIHCDTVIHTKEVEETVEQWQIGQDGIWSMDQFRNPLPSKILQSEAWKEAKLGYTTMEVYARFESHAPRYSTRPLSEREEDGSIELEDYCFLTPFDNTSLLVLPHGGAPFRLEIGKEVVLYEPSTLDSGRENMYTFSLGKDSKKYIDLMVKEWQEDRAIKPAMAAEFLYTRSLRSLVFLCNAHWRPTTKEYVTAIMNRMPEVRLIEERLDGTYVLGLPNDEWTICAQLDHTWLYSAKAKDRIRITSRDVEGIAEIAERASEIWEYITKK